MSFFLKRSFEDGRVLHVDAKDSDMKVEWKESREGGGSNRADIYLFRHEGQIRGKQLSFIGTFILRRKPGDLLVIPYGMHRRT